jgi:hypothetical protein
VIRPRFDWAWLVLDLAEGMGREEEGGIECFISCPGGKDSRV